MNQAKAVVIKQMLQKQQLRSIYDMWPIMSSRFAWSYWMFTCFFSQTKYWTKMVRVAVTGAVEIHSATASPSMEKKVLNNSSTDQKTVHIECIEEKRETLLIKRSFSVFLNHTTKTRNVTHLLQKMHLLFGQNFCYCIRQ